MIYSFRNPIWLCWILSCLLPFVLGQSGSNGFGGGGGGSSDGFGRGGGSFRNGGRFGGDGSPGGGNFGPNRFRQGQGNRGDRFGGEGSGDREGVQQQGEQSFNDEEQQTTEEAAPSSIAPTTAASTVAVPTISEEEETTSAPASINVPAFTSSTESFQQPSSVVDAFPEPASTTLPLAGIPLVAPTNTIASDITSTAATFNQFPLSSSAPSTVTTSMTVWVTPSSIAETTAAPAEEGASTPTEASPSSSIDLAPLPTSPGSTMSASEQAGMGIGITFGLLSIAGATGLYLWRRRRNQRLDRDSLTRRSGKGGLGGFFRLRSCANTPSKNDPEWSIESAAKVEIMRGGSVKSVRTGSRSDSLPSTFPMPSTNSSPLSVPQVSAGGERKMGGGVGVEVLKVGMRVPDRKPNLALTSNPPVSPSEFPTPPNSSGKDRKGGEKTSSWPLPD